MRNPKLVTPVGCKDSIVNKLCLQIQLHKCNNLVELTLGSSMKLGLAVEMSPSVFNEQFTSCERMSHAASADSLLLST